MMAGLLESLSMGLRGAGGIMSEDVFRGQRQEELIQQQLQEKRKDLMAQQIIKAAESGAMPPETAKQALTQIGYQGLAVGPDAQTQERARKAQLDAGYRQALDQLGPDAPFSEQARIAARFGKPEVAAQMYNAAETRKLRETQIVSELQRAREKLAQDMEIARQRGADQRELAQMRIDAQKQITEMMMNGRRELAAIAGSLRQPPAPVITEIADPNDPTKGIKIDARTRQVIGASPPKVQTDKPLNETQSKNVLFGARAAGAHDLLSALEDDISTVGLAVKQSIGRVPITGGILEAAGNLALSDNQQRVEQAQRNFVNAVLRQESGAAIPEPEFANAKKQYFPQPGDSPAVIQQKRLNREIAIKGFRHVAGPGATAIDNMRAEQARSLPKKKNTPPPPPGFKVD